MLLKICKQWKWSSSQNVKKTSSLFGVVFSVQVQSDSSYDLNENVIPIF